MEQVLENSFSFQITAFVVIPITLNRGILCACLLVGGFLFFFVVSKLGEKLLEKLESKLDENNQEGGHNISTITLSTVQ